MPRPTTFGDALDKSLPRIRVTSLMFGKILSVSDELDISVSDVVRGCVAHVLGFEDQNSELVARRFRKAAQDQD